MKKLTIGHMVSLAENKNGKCLSEFYVNSRTRLSWQCSNGHQWMATPSKIQQGRWCRQCSVESSRLSFQQITELIQSKNGELITKKYYRTDQNLEIKCQYGHTFLSSIDRIKKGCWCKHCFRNKRFLGIDLMNKLASQKKGKCLSKIYNGIYHKLEWECFKGHRWSARPDNIRQGKWCPYCASFKSERKTKFIFEQFTGLSFIKTRKILQGGLELDGYCKELNIAFEYQGQQHYEFLPKFYYKTQKDFQKLQFNDRSKVKQCKDMKINLIVVPYFKNTSDNDLEQFIRQSLVELNVNIAQEIEFFDYYLLDENLKLAKKLAHNKKGKILSKVIENHIIKLKWQCQEGHIWEAPLARIQRGAWCRKCFNKFQSFDIDFMKDWAQKFNGYCLSKTCINGSDTLSWKCQQGHEWELNYHSMKQRKRWCIKCY